MNTEGRLTRLEKQLGWSTSTGDRTRTILSAMPNIAPLLEKRFPEVYEEVVDALSADPEASSDGLLSAMPIVFSVLEQHPEALEEVKKWVRSTYPKVSRPRGDFAENPATDRDPE
ncbi:hypothetical protein ES705_09412 [subsurface metagenome]